MLPEALGIVGLGAVGGSIAWSAARNGVKQVTGYCFSHRDGVAAAKSGAITELATDFRRVVMRSELVVLATEPRRTLELLDRLAELTIQGAYFTDVSPVKQPIVDKAARLGLAARFAGSHPVSGSPGDRFELARPDRLAGKVVYVTPLPGGRKAADEVADFWERAIGAHPVRLEAQIHDRVLARRSHLPRAVAAALASVLRREPKGSTYGSAALNATDPAKGEVDAWADVLTLNRNYLMEALTGFEEEIRSLEEALRRGDREAVLEWLEQARRWREGVEP